LSETKLLGRTFLRQTSEITMPRTGILRSRTDTGLGRKLIAEIKEAKARGKRQPARQSKSAETSAPTPAD
jgi:hypothetical protein